MTEYGQVGQAHGLPGAASLRRRPAAPVSAAAGGMAVGDPRGLPAAVPSADGGQQPMTEYGQVGQGHGLPASMKFICDPCVAAPATSRSGERRGRRHGGGRSARAAGCRALRGWRSATDD